MYYVMRTHAKPVHVLRSNQDMKHKQLQLTRNIDMHTYTIPRKRKITYTTNRYRSEGEFVNTE